MNNTCINIKNLTKSYKDLIAVDNLNLTIYEGELFALLGVNGAGKTTTIKMLSCLTKPTSGEALIYNYSINNDEYKIKNIIALSMQETAIARNLTVKENLEFYFEVFGLGKWFNFENLVYDNGTFPGKPAPDIFLIASQKLNLKPEDCLVVEDAYSGILAAKKAHIGKIIAIDPFNKNFDLFTKNSMCDDGIIKDFTHFFEVANEFQEKVVC